MKTIAVQSIRRRTPISVFGLFISFCCLWGASDADGFDAVGDFSTNNNPDGVWSYGWATAAGNSFQLAATAQQVSGSSAVGWGNGLPLPNTCVLDKDFANFFTSGSVAFYPDTLHLDPQSYAVMARFTAPSNGAYQVNGLFRMQDSGAHPHDLAILVNGSTTNYHVLASGGNTTQYPFTFATNLTGGATVDFVVSCHNGDFDNLGTGLKVTITPATGTTYNWTGTASSDWFNPTNWSPQGIPGSLDMAVITNGSPTVGTATNVGSVALGVTGTLNANAGLTVSNLFNWTGGSIAGELIIASNATLNANYPGNNLFVYGATIVNNGTVLWDGGTLYGNQTTTVTNNGLWVAQTDDSFYDPYGGAPAFYNNGVFTKAPSTGTTSFNGVPFNNTGTVNINSGALTLYSGGALGGSFLAASNTTVTIASSSYLNGSFTGTNTAQFLLTSGTFTYGPNVNFAGSGNNRITGGSITLTNNPIANLAIDGGTVSLSPTFQNGAITNLTMVSAILLGANTVSGTFNFDGTVTGNLTVVPGAKCYITNLVMNGTLTIATNATLNLVSGNNKIFYGSTVINNGTVLWNGGTLYYNQSTVMTNNGTWQAETDDQIYNVAGGSPVFYNNGIFTKSPTTGTTLFNGMVVNNTGTLDAQTGTININSPGQFLGAFEAAGGGTINLSGGGYLDGTNTSATNGQILLSGGAFTYGPGLAFTGPGPNILTGGSITLTNSPIPNLSLNGGTLSLGPNFQGGTITNLTLTGATLSGTNLLTGTMHWQSGAIAGAFTVAPTGALYLDGYADVYQYAALTNAGHIIWNGSANWRLYNDTGLDGSVNNLVNATLDIECNQSLYPPNGNQIGWLNNAGLVRKSLSGGTTVISVTLTNTGTVDLLDGAINFGSGFFGGQFVSANGTTMNFGNGGVLSGAFTAGEQAAVNLTSGAFTQTPSVTFGGAGTFQMTGSSATLTLLNSTIPNLQLDSGTILTGPSFQGGAITNLTLNGLSLNTSNLVTGTLTVIGNINGPLVVASNAVLSWNGAVNAQITVMPGATLNWEGGATYTPLYIPSNAVLNATGVAFMQSQNWLTNAGTFNWTGGQIRPYCNYGIYNLAGATFNIECDQSMDDYCGPEFFSNAGLFRKLPSVNSPTTGTTSFDLVMDNTGVVDAQAGTVNFQNFTTNAPTGIYQCESNAGLTFSGGGLLSGPYTAAAGSGVVFSGGTFTITPPLLLNGAGTYQMTGGTLTLTNSLIPNLQMLGGVIDLPPGFQGGSITNLTLNGASIGSSNLVTGTLTVNGNINAPLVVASNAVLSWNGAVNAQITVMPGATLNWEGGSISTPLYIPSNAVLNATGVAFMQSQNWLTNAGTFNWTGGDIRPYCDYGIYNLAGATFNVECDHSMDDYCGPEFFSNAGLFRKWMTSGTTGFDIAMDNTGVIDVQSGTVNFENFATNSATGIYQCESNASLTFSGGGNLSGAYTAAAGSDVNFSGGTFAITQPLLLNGAGVYEMTGGTLTLTNSLIPNLQMLGGVIDFPPGFQGGSITNVTLNGVSIGSSNLVTGTLTIIGNINAPLTVASNATFSWNGSVNAQITVMPGATLNWEGGSISTPLYIPSNAVLNATGVAFMQSQNWLTNAGTFNWTGGDMRPYCGYGFYNLAGATFNVECDHSMDYYCNTEVFYNAGLFRKWMTSGATAFGIVINNTGVIDVESGALNLQNTVNQTGGAWEIGLNGAGNNGQINFSGAAPLATADLMVHLNSGEVLGLSNSFTLLNYSSYSGTFAATNLPPGGASWKLNFGPSALTLQLTNLNAPQNVAITSPVNNQSFTIPVNIGITATATDPYAPISSVQFYQGTNLLGQALTSPYTFTWNSVQPGTYALSVLATDTAGAVATSAPVSIAVYYNHAQTTNYTWTGASSSDWFTPANWSPNGVPGALDNAALNNNGAINLANNVSVNNFTLTSGTLAGTGALTVTNAAAWNGGAINGSLNMATNSALTISASVTLTGLLINNGVINLANGNIYGGAAGIITNNGLWVSQTGNNVGLNNELFVNNGILRVAAPGGNIAVGAQNFINNGTVDAENGSISFNNGGTLAGTYNYAATGGIYFSSGTFALGALPNFTGSGVLEFSGGTLQVATTVPAALQLAGGAVVPGPIFQNAGAISNLTLAGATLSGTNTVTGTMNWTGGSLSGQLTVGSTGLLNISSGNNKFIYGSSLLNSGRIIWTGGYLYGDGNSKATNNGVWLDETDAQINFGNGNSTFVNNNLFEKTNSTGTTSFYNLNFINNGEVDAESGTIAFESGGTPAGAYNAAAGAAIDFANGAFIVGAVPTLTGAGVIQFTGGAMSIATNIPPGLQLTGGAFTLGPAFQNGGAINNLTNYGAVLSGAYTVSGTMTWLSGSANGSLTIASNATLNLIGSGIQLGSCAFTNNGTFNWSSGQINGNSATSFINNGLWLASANNNFENGDCCGTAAATNNGIFRNLSGATTFYGTTFANFGLVDVEGGAVNFNYGGTLAGTYNVAQYGGLYFSGGNFTAQTPPVITGPGLAQFSGGALTLLSDQIPGLALAGGSVVLGQSFQNSGAITNLTLAGSTLTGTNTVSGALDWTSGGLNGGWLTVAPNGLLNFTGGNAKNLGNSVLVNNGTVLWSGGAIQGNGGAFITNNGLWLIQTDNTLNDAICCGLPTFVNNGTLTKSGTFGTTTVSGVTVINSGVFDIESGSINLINSSTYGQTEATLTVGISAPNLQGQLNVPGPISFDGALNVHFLNGYTPNVGDLFQPIFYGSSSGAFANLNLPTLAAGQSWNLEYGGGSVSLGVTGPATNATNTLLITGAVTGTGNQGISNVTVYAALNASNLIQNGSFEEPSIGGSAYTLYSLGSTNITNWTVIGRAGANVALTSYNWVAPAEDGNQFLDPTGNTGGGGVAQTFPTVVGSTYNLIFYHGTYNNTGFPASLAVGLGGNVYTFGETSGGGGNLDWRQVIIPFTAASNLTTLSFSDTTDGDYNDNFVDNVQVLPAGADSIAQAITDTTGHYQLTVPNGALVVGVSGLGAAGYNPVATQTVNMANANQVVNFSATPAAVPQQFTITTAVLPAGAGTATGGGVFSSGATVTVNATALTTSLPYSFSAWTENGVFQSSVPSYPFTAIRNRALVANFVLPVFTVTVSNNPPTAGTVSGAGSFSYGTTNVLTATPNFGYLFTNWTEGAAIVGATPTLTNVLLAGHTFVANYAAANVTHVVTTVTSPPGLASVAGGGTYINGQSANFSAPLFVTNSPNLYTFQEFTLSNTVASSVNSFSKTFSTLDPTNLQYVAVYSVSSILPQLTGVSVNYSPLVPATTNFVLRLQFNRSMLANFSPIILLTNTAAAIQPVLATNGSWSATLISNDTYSTPPITISPGMDGTMQLYVSGATDTNGDALALTNAGQFTIEATAPVNPILTQVSSNSSSITVGWSAYNAPSDLAGFRVYIQPANFSSVAGLSVLTGLNPGTRSYQFNNLSLDTPYYVAVQAVDTAGNSLSGVTPLEIILPSSLPPAVGINVSAVGASSALVSWNGYSTAGLLGFAGYYVYYEQTNFASAAGLTPQATLGPSQTSYQVNGLDRAKTNYFAVVAFNADNNFYPNVFPTAWTDPYGGAIGVNTTIGGGAPGVVAIYHSIVVAGNATLTVAPGTTLLFRPGTSLTVGHGNLVANGTALAPIIFDSANDVSGGSPAAGDWGGVMLDVGAGGSSLQFVEILYGGGLTLNGCSPSVQALTANFNAPSGLLAENGATLTTANALISGNQVGAQQSDTAALNLSGSVIQNNLTNAWAAGSATLTAASDWWGTATQGSLTPLLTGNVTYTPFLTSEPVLTPAIGTSNGVTQVGVSPVVLQLACRTATSMRLSEDFTFNGVFFTPFSNYATFPLSAGGGLKHIFAQFRSVTGQTNTPVELDLNFITQGPVIQSFSLSDGETLGRPLTVTASATATLGMNDIEFYLDGVGLATNLGGSFSYHFDVRTLNNAVHQAELIARDTSGNIATLEEDVIVAVTPPLAPTITVPNSDYVTNNSNITIHGTAEPNISIQVTANGQVLGTTTTDANGNFSVANATLSEGVNSIVAVASDGTGSTASPTRHINVETIPPVAVIMNAPAYSQSSGLTISWSLAVSGKQPSTFQLFWAKSPFTATNQATGHSVLSSSLFDTLQGLAAGTYYFGVVGFDAAGNPSALSSLVSSLYDPTPPVLSIAYGSPSPVGVSVVSITLASSKALAGIPTLIIQPNGAPSPTQLILTNVALNTWQTAFVVTNSTPSGVAAVSATAQDQVGNVFSGSPAGAALVIDTTPPTATIVTAPLGPVQTISGATVAVSLTLTKPAAQGTTPTLSFNPPQGANVPLSLTGSGTNWTASLALTSAMGSGLGQFAFSSQDSVGNVGANITTGRQLELYNTANPSPPPAPINFTAASLPGGFIALTWNAVGNAQIYRIYRETGTNSPVPTVLDIDNLTSTTVTDLPPVDGLYAYGISASRLGSESAISNVVIALSDRTPPPAPTNVTVQLAAVGVQITWQQPPGETPDHYVIYRNGVVLQSVSGIVPVTDYPPRGTDTYIVAAVDLVGNQSASLPASIQLLVSPVNNLSVLVVASQAPALTWTSTDSTVAGFNLYRNGVKQNSTPLASPAYTDSLPVNDVVSYGVTALNASSQESPQRVVHVSPVALGLVADGNQPLLINYFDSIVVNITNLSPTAALPLAQFVLTRAVTGVEPLAVTQAVTSINASSSASQVVILPEAPVVGNQTMTVNAFQQTDSEGDNVVYQQTFVLTNSELPGAEIAVSANQLPLAGGLTSFQVNIINQGYAPMQVIVSRGFNAKPGDVYISVRNNLGQEVSRTAFQGTPPGATFASDGTGYINIAAGASLSFAVPNVLTPEALAGTTNVIFAAVAGAIYNQIETPAQVVSGPISGSMVAASLALPPYYGTSQTDHTAYTNDEPVVISGQAISQSTGLPVTNVTLNIGFATRGYQWYQAVTTDANGSYQYTFNPPPGFGGTLSIWAANPLVVDQLNQNTFTISRIYCTPQGEDIEMSKNGTINFSIQLINPGDTALTAVATGFSAYQVSGTNLTPITTLHGTNLTGSSFTIAPNQSQTVNLELAAGVNAPDSAQVAFTFTSASGASVTLTGSIDLLPAVPVLSVPSPTTGYLEVSLNRGDQTSGQLTIMNSGLATLSGITVLPPTNSWIALNLPISGDGLIHLPDLAVGQSNIIGVVFSPPISTPLAYYSDTVTVQATNLATPYAINVYARVTSDLTGGVQFEVDDILGEQVSGASVRLNNSLTAATVGPFYTDTNGLVTVSNLEEGTWNWEVTAPGCSANVGTVTVVADQVAYQPTRLSRSLVTVSFSVVPVPFSDQYTIQVEQTFETFVPAGVLVLQPPAENYNNVTPGFEANFICAAQNYGLVQMTDVNIGGSQSGQGVITPLITYIPVLLPEQIVDIPMVFTYGAAAGVNGPQGGAQTRQGPNIAGCVGDAITGAFGFGDLTPDNAAALAGGLAAILNAQERCVKDDQIQNATAALAVLYGLGQLANDFSDAASVVASVAAQAVGCMIGNLLAGIGGSIPGSGSYGNSPDTFIGQPVGCFAAETLVRMADGSEKQISAVNTHDIVKTGTHPWDVATVEQVLTLSADNTCSIQFYNPAPGAPDHIVATSEHLFWVDGQGWRPAGTLKRGDWLFNFRGERVQVASNTPNDESMKVYTLGLLGDAAFYANGVLVHDLCGATARTTTVVQRKEAAK